MGLACYGFPNTTINGKDIRMSTGAGYADRFAAALQEKFAEDRFPPTYVVHPGRKYDKIVEVGEHQHFVHAFVEVATGALIKPAGWNGPQRDKDGLAVRHHLATQVDFDAALAVADRYGHYLYLP